METIPDEKPPVHLNDHELLGLINGATSKRSGYCMSGDAAVILSIIHGEAEVYRYEKTVKVDGKLLLEIYENHVSFAKEMMGSRIKYKKCGCMYMTYTGSRLQYNYGVCLEHWLNSIQVEYAALLREAYNAKYN